VKDKLVERSKIRIRFLAWEEVLELSSKCRETGMCYFVVLYRPVYMKTQFPFQAVKIQSKTWSGPEGSRRLRLPD
jgi:hypothetical protein